jgi:hypothetical protein
MGGQPHLLKKPANQQEPEVLDNDKHAARLDRTAIDET